MNPLFDALGMVPAGVAPGKGKRDEIVRQRQLFSTVRPPETARRFTGDEMGIDLDAFDLPVSIGSMPLEQEPLPSVGKAAGVARERMPLEAPARAGKRRVPVDAPKPKDRAGRVPDILDEPAVPEVPEPDGFEAPQLSDLENRGKPSGTHPAG